MPQTPPVIDQIQASQQSITDILNKIETVVLGKPKECRLALACLLAQGHLLIEDLPGMGKTTLAHVLATTLALNLPMIYYQLMLSVFQFLIKRLIDSNFTKVRSLIKWY